MIENKVTLGSWITIGNTSIAEIMAKEGFDWLAIDMEHSAITLSEAQQVIRVIDLCGVTPLVRVGENNPTLIKRILDAGAHGIIVPMVNTKEEAIKAVNAVKYPPVGKRGVGLSRAQGYGLEFERYKDWASDHTLTIVQIEHIDAINNLEDILQTKGINASIIGPYDLSASLGYPGEFERPDVKEAIKKYVDTCDKLNKPAGYHVINPNAAEVNEKIDKGFKFIGFSLDILFFGSSVRSQLKDIRRENSDKK